VVARVYITRNCNIPQYLRLVEPVVFGVVSVVCAVSVVHIAKIVRIVPVVSVRQIKMNIAVAFIPAEASVAYVHIGEPAQQLGLSCAVFSVVAVTGVTTIR
jgi:hypothetical protein